MSTVITFRYNCIRVSNYHVNDNVLFGINIPGKFKFAIQINSF